MTPNVCSFDHLVSSRPQGDSLKRPARLRNRDRFTSCLVVTNDKRGRIDDSYASSVPKRKDETGVLTRNGFKRRYWSASQATTKNPRHSISPHLHNRRLVSRFSKREHRGNPFERRRLANSLLKPLMDNATLQCDIESQQSIDPQSLVFVGDFRALFRCEFT